MPRARRQTVRIPSIGSSEKTLQFNDYSRGYDSFRGDDAFPNKEKGNFWRLVQNGRITTLGEYETRKGIDFHSDAAGLTEDDTETSTTGADEQDFSNTVRVAQKFTTSSAGRLPKIELNIKNDSSATGVVKVQIYSDNSGEPGTLLATSTVTPSDITSSFAYATVRFNQAPELTTSTDYWIVVWVQNNGSNSYTLSTTTNSTNALVSSNSGTSWSTQTFSINFRQYYATSGATKGLFRAVKSDGTVVTLFAHETSLYSVNNVTGALTAIKTGLSSSATHYRFVVVNDVVYYCNEYDGLRKWDFSTESQVNTTNYSTLAVHKGLLFGARVDDPSRFDFSNFGEYETFTSTDFLYAPAPKTGDPITALVSLNGYLMIFTKDNKYILSGDDNATFAVDEAPDQKGTPTQESTTVDKNFVYYVGNDGIYRSNGSDAQLISANIYNDVLTDNNKEDMVVNVNRGRLYVWHRGSAGDAFNGDCYVLNLNYEGDVVESHDTKTYVSRGITSAVDGNKMLVASSIIGQVYWQELTTNDHSDLGGDIDFLLQTHYNPYDDPASLKEIRYWNPRFEAQSGNHDVSAEYAYDGRDNWTTYDEIAVQGEGPIWGSFTWGDGSIWGTTAELQSYLYVPGEYRRIAIRYKHFASRQPNKFLGHTFRVQTRRMR